jgi:hypothetical protein
VFIVGSTKHRGARGDVSKEHPWATPVEDGMNEKRVLIVRGSGSLSLAQTWAMRFIVTTPVGPKTPSPATKEI